MVQITLDGLSIPSIKVYPHLESFDNGVFKRSGGLCGNWKLKNNFVDECQLYYKEGRNDKCLNSTAAVENNIKFRDYWR